MSIVFISMPLKDTSAPIIDSNLIGKTTGATPEFQYEAARLTDQYQVIGLSYPEDLMGNDKQYGAHKVIFYINVSVDSRVLKRGVDLAVVEGVQRDMRGKLVGQNVTNFEASEVTTIAGAVTGAGASKFFNTGNKAFSAIVGGAIGLGGSAAIAANVNNQEVAPGQQKQLTFTRPQKRLKSAIALHIPNQLSTRYSTSWGEEDTAGFSMAAAAAKSANEVARAIEGSKNRAAGLAQEIVGAIALNAAPFGKELGIAAGVAANPKKEQAFKGVDYRTFTFDYQFAPKSPSEAENVLNIIKAFKYHMHPEFKSNDAFLYVYPSEFDIVYYKGTEENLKIHRHTSCVLTEMNVNYTPNGVFTTFDNGMPTQINLTLTFRELMLLSKETIEKYT